MSKKQANTVRQSFDGAYQNKFKPITKSAFESNLRENTEDAAETQKAWLNKVAKMCNNIVGDERKPITVPVG